MSNEPQDIPKSMNASERVASDILKGLYEGRYVQGQRLTESDLVEKFDVSRTTVREAIKKLSAQGIVEIQPNKGARIRTISSRETRNILLITELITGLAARLAAENIDQPGAHEQIENALEDLIASGKGQTDAEFMRRRNRFHRTLSRIADCPEINNILTNLQVHLVRTRLVMDPKEREQSYSDIAKKVMDGDANAAEQAARAHVRKVVELHEKHEKATPVA